jgi:lipoic acid synthetase
VEKYKILENQSEIFMLERTPKPAWLKANLPSGQTYFKIKNELERKNLSTICQSAKCPNTDKCWNKKHATFLLMGDICSRGCTFCSVNSGVPQNLDPMEGKKIVEMAKILNLTYCVLTSVTRDDLDDGGSSHFSQVVTELKTDIPDLLVEVLIPDFNGDLNQLDRVFQAKPDVVNHNLETVKQLYPTINRNPNNYGISLSVLKHANNRGFVTKSGVMVGMGENIPQLLELLNDLREAHVDLLTIGQYCQPSSENIPVEKYYAPAEFSRLKEIALSLGFKGVESGPLVRSSFGAEEMYRTMSEAKQKRIL